MTTEPSEQVDFDCVRLCPDVGKCCRRLTLAIQHTTGIRPLDYVTPIEDVQKILKKIKLPFKIWGITKGGKWVFTCKALDSEGLCTKYEDRPRICREFTPGNSSCLVSEEFVARVTKAKKDAA